MFTEILEMLFFQIQLLLAMKEGMKMVREAAKCRQVINSHFFFAAKFRHVMC